MWDPKATFYNNNSSQWERILFYVALRREANAGACQNSNSSDGPHSENVKRFWISNLSLHSDNSRQLRTLTGKNYSASIGEGPFTGCSATNARTRSDFEKLRKMMVTLVAGTFNECATHCFKRGCYRIFPTITCGRASNRPSNECISAELCLLFLHYANVVLKSVSHCAILY